MAKFALGVLDGAVDFALRGVEALDHPDKVALHVLGGPQDGVVRGDDVVGVVRHDRAIGTASGRDTGG